MTETTILPEAKNEYADNFSKFMDIYQKVVNESLRFAEENRFWQDLNMPDIWSEFLTKTLENPEKFYQKQLELYTDYLRIWGNVFSQFLGEETPPLYSPDTKDKRFRDQAWHENIIFNFLKQSYLLTSKWAQKTVYEMIDSDPKMAERVDFYTRQMMDAMSPSNFAFSNPEVIRTTIDSKGQNLIKGFTNLLHDLEHSKRIFHISTANNKAFHIGENIAKTPGNVIFRNHLCEVIHYTPTQPECYRVPLLMIPAWINKFYIFDLSEQNSFVKWLLEQGHNVFIISWINPDKTLSHVSFEDYMLEGLLAAIDAVEGVTGQKQINLMAYCLGGTLVACLLSYLTKKHQIHRISSATFLTTLIDFSYVGDFSIFTDETTLHFIEQRMQQSGYLDGPEISAIFSSIRANDLIWSFVINNYLLGKEPFPFDILYWNSDSTRLPAAMHAYYLRNMYLENNLIKPGKLVLGGVPIDITDIHVPVYLFAAREDHIAPWKTTYTATQLFAGSTTYVLGASGHVAGVINPPSLQKYSYWTADSLPQSADTWLQNATEHQGSWWQHWLTWAVPYAGNKVTSKHALRERVKMLGTAPGSYILTKS